MFRVGFLGIKKAILVKFKNGNLGRISGQVWGKKSEVWGVFSGKNLIFWGDFGAKIRFFGVVLKFGAKEKKMGKNLGKTGNK